MANVLHFSRQILGAFGLGAVDHLPCRLHQQVDDVYQRRRRVAADGVDDPAERSVLERCEVPTEDRRGER